MSVWEQIYTAHLTIGGSQITWREIIGNGFGMASAIGGMRRKVWAWPVGIVGNVLLFTVFAGLVFGMDDRAPMFGQAGRQIFFIVTSLYGWYVWRESKNKGSTGEAVIPHWASAKQRLGYVIAWGAGVVVMHWVFEIIGAGWPAPWWYFWCDAWIFVGSLFATYAMARGWNDFWLMWLAVDLVGVPELIYSKYYPSAALYALYALLVAYGFTQWLRASRSRDVAAREMEAS